MKEFIIKANEYLKQDCRAFYHTDYLGFNKPGNPDYLITLKNSFNKHSISEIENAIKELKDVLLDKLPKILKSLNLDQITICVTPRAKAKLRPNQLLLSSTTKRSINGLEHFHNGIPFISRHTSTKTIYPEKPLNNHINNGPLPYPGITIDTCDISDSVKDKDILLIDDIYICSANIDEDAIQALLDKGARSVAFYSISKTVENLE